MINETERVGQGPQTIAEMRGEVLKKFAEGIVFDSPEFPSDEIRGRLDARTFDKSAGERIAWDASVHIRPELLSHEKGTAPVIIHIARHQNASGDLMGIYFFEESDVPSGYSEIEFNGDRGKLPVGEPFILWNTSESDFQGQGRGLLRTIVMGEYMARARQVKKSLDAGTMEHSVRSFQKGADKKDEDRTLKYPLHIWQALVYAGLAELKDGRYRYLIRKDSTV